jgi:hypothetical protein
LRKVFQDYYRTAPLAEEADPNKLHDLKAALDAAPPESTVREILISPDPYKVVRRYPITNQDHRVTRPASRKCSSNSGRFLFALKKDSSHFVRGRTGTFDS